MDRAIPSDSNFGKPRRLDAMVGLSHSGAQQLEKCYDWAIAQSNYLLPLLVQSNSKLREKS